MIVKPSVLARALAAHASRPYSGDATLFSLIDQAFDETTRYSVVVADPGWPFKDKLPGKGRGAAKNYLTTAIQSIIDIKGSDEHGDYLEMCGRRAYLADDCILVLWRVSSMVEEAYQVARGWSFDPTKGEIVWNKLTKKGKEWFGMGRIVRGAHETAIIATRGKSARVISNKNVRSTFEAKVPYYADGKKEYLHSAKPTGFHDIIEKLAKGPYLELFARRHHPGWMCLGNQVDLPKTRKVIG